MTWNSKKQQKTVRIEHRSQDQSPLIKVVKSNYSNINKDDEFLDKWYVRIAAMVFAPVYAVLKAYDLARWIGKCFTRAMHGLFELFIFLFCFGWFFRTFLFKKFKRIRCIRYLNKKKVHLHILNIGAALLQAYVLRLLIPIPPDHSWNKYLTPVCGAFGGLILLISFKFAKLHCFCLLVLPMSASRHGRRFLLALVVVSLYEGPIFNIQHNTDIIIEQMNCIADKGKQTSDAAAEQMKEPYRKLQNQVMEVKNKTQQKMKEIQDTIEEAGRNIEEKYAFLKNVVRKVNDFYRKCERTMTTLNNKCDAAFECGNDEKRSAKMNFFPDSPTGEDVNVTDGKYLFPEDDEEFDDFVDNYDGEAIYLNDLYDKYSEMHNDHKNENSDVDTSDTEKDNENGFNKEKRFGEEADNMMTELLTELPVQSDVNPVHFLANNSYRRSSVSENTNSSSDHDSTENSTEDDKLYPLSTEYHDKDAYHAQHPMTTVHHGKVFHIRTRRGWFDDILCFFKKVFGLMAKPLCNVIFNSIVFLCRIPKLLMHFVTGIMMNRFKYIQRTIKNNVWMDIKSNLTYEREVVEVRSARTAFVELKEKIEDRLKIKKPAWIRWTDYAKLLTLLMVYYKTFKYLSNYCKDISFDNHYIDSALIKRDGDAEKSIFPLTSKDRKKFVVPTQSKMLPHESFLMTRSSIKALVTVFAVVVIEGGNQLLQLLVSIMFKYGPVKVEHTINVGGKDSTNTYGLTNNTLYLLFDTTSCFRPPTVTPYSITAYNLAIAFAILVLSVTQVFFLRTRHIICDRFIPGQKIKRVNYLHSKIRKSREFYVKHLTENLFQKAAEKSKLARILPWTNKPKCILCSTTHYLQRCNDCDTMYCVNCLTELNNDCQICGDPAYRRRSVIDMAHS